MSHIPASCLYISCSYVEGQCARCPYNPAQSESDRIGALHEQVSRLAAELDAARQERDALKATCEKWIIRAIEAERRLDALDRGPGWMWVGRVK